MQSFILKLKSDVLMENPSQEEIARFYDEYVPAQIKTGLNLRHFAILQHLKKAGLRHNHHIWEIGCGIGPVSELLLRYLGKSGSLIGTDISPESVKYAQNRLRKYHQASFEVSDTLSFEKDQQFDFILLPDVLEHIPVPEHPRLFATIRKHLKTTGTVLIHIPNPLYLESLILHQHENLQVIEQPVHTNEFIGAVYQNDLVLESLQSYSLYDRASDYQVIVLRPLGYPRQTSALPKASIIARKWWLKILSWF